MACATPYGLGSYLLGLQLWVLIAYVLFLLSTNAAELRDNEVALAKLRGLPTPKVVGLGIAEPLLLVVIAVPLGIALATGSGPGSSLPRPPPRGPPFWHSPGPYAGR